MCVVLGIVTLGHSKSLEIWATSAMSGLEIDAKNFSPNLLFHMGPPVGEKLPILQGDFEFHAVALPPAWVRELIYNYGKLGRFKSPFYSGNLLDRDGDNIVRPFRSLWTNRVKVLVVGVTPKTESGGIRGVFYNAPEQALKSLAQNLYRRLRFHFLVALFPGPRGAAKAFAERAGVADVVIYTERPEGEDKIVVLDLPGGKKTVLVPAPAEGWGRVLVNIKKNDEGRYRILNAHDKNLENSDQEKQPSTVDQP